MVTERKSEFPFLGDSLVTQKAHQKTCTAAALINALLITGVSVSERERETILHTAQESPHGLLRTQKNEFLTLFGFTLQPVPISDKVISPIQLARYIQDFSCEAPLLVGISAYMSRKHIFTSTSENYGDIGHSVVIVGERSSEYCIDSQDPRFPLFIDVNNTEDTFVLAQLLFSGFVQQQYIQTERDIPFKSYLKQKLQDSSYFLRHIGSIWTEAGFEQVTKIEQKTLPNASLHRPIT